ncbi:HSP20 family protein [Herbihabitans rhizosphaerae]|uniref:HSP20 family protein n=1 Tax=Herbihabitans rhizosphaerae TaxID=1872711 RepID=A0A4Q7L7D8_9PSEU|nr:Hsp20/alpha crystallin family protein [Herbihabitans rhizosphaerae]RZS45216.1 HSP20 family protein [Herbihabitans rhizosphaerae]
MALAVRTTRDPFGALFRQLDGDFDSLIRRSFPAGTGQFVPAVDVVKDGTDVVVTVEVPGVDVEKDVEVEVAEGKLVISGSRAERASSEERGVLVRESRSGSFRREFSLPEHVTAESVEATYDRGLLHVRVRDVSKPKVEPRKIQVRGLTAGERPAVEGGTESDKSGE